MQGVKLAKLLFLCLLLTSVFTSCQEKADFASRSWSMADYADWQRAAYEIDAHRIDEYIGRQIRSDKDSMAADYRARRYYLSGGHYLWIDRYGVDRRADTVLAWLRMVDDVGFDTLKFQVDKIGNNLRRIRQLDLDSGTHDINHVMARLEYNLTKAYLRYVSGQRFGYVNPTAIFNRLDVIEKDSGKVAYRGLFDIKMEHADNAFYERALRLAKNDSVMVFLKSVQPAGTYHSLLKNKIHQSEMTPSERTKVLVNLERSRWRLADNIENYRKYVIVNIPSFHLQAINGDDTLTMKIGCGSLETKTPLLTSQIYRMEINPQWILPRSIIEKTVSRHVGDVDYFKAEHFFVRDRKTGERIPPERITWDMLQDRRYLVIQEGGEGNSLGRIIFRFNNKFSVYLHHTSSPRVFAREDRGVSHGCVRVEKPFELAAFMLDKKDEVLLDKIAYSMSADVSMLGHRNKAGIPDTLNRRRLIGQISLNPHIPIFITYYTLYPKGHAGWAEFADVYGYDQVIYRVLKNYI